ncbi:NADH-quinone oxidoreductase subunit C [candidate division KSB1 bacterium]|nr:NADH-quinone oxidoreductase subunit C [candidate division KSB1 bacterium]
MPDFSRLQKQLAENFKDRVQNLRVVRGNELHFRVTRGNAIRLARMLRSEFQAELILMVATDRRAGTGHFEVQYIFANSRENWFACATKELPAENPTIVSMATFYYPASRFEREIKDLFGIQATGSPDRRPLVRHGFWPEDFFPLRKDTTEPPQFEDDGTPFPFLPVSGEGVYEIPVGPVHAGIIEPGHFRFSVVGETVIDLKIRLYFTHKGTEKLFEGRAPAEGVELAERISGDTTIGHSLAYCQALEKLSASEVPMRAQYLRVVLLEMERLYNHIADFGMIANDTGFPVAHSHCFRLRERLLRLNKRITGNRLLRGGLVPGGVARDFPSDLPLAAELDAILADFKEIVDISLSNTILMDRLEGAGTLSQQTAVDHGVLGYVARASGIDVDVRRDHPFDAYHALKFNVPVFKSGDVYARTMVRVEEIHESVSLIKRALSQLPSGPLVAPLRALPAFEPAFGMVEGWRGAIAHWVMVDNVGKLFRVKVKDPSFANWPALSFALLKNIVPDFPLCNKSFNQSYSGNDL